VDPTWIAARRPHDHVTLTDARGRRRRLTVSGVHCGGVLAEGTRGAFIREGCTLHCSGAWRVSAPNASDLLAARARAGERRLRSVRGGWDG